MRRVVVWASFVCIASGCYLSHERARPGGDGRDAGGPADASAIVDGTVMPPPDDELPGPLAEVCVGVGFACARMDDGGVYCWGSNEEGAVGDGTLGGVREDPVRVEGLPVARRLECTNRSS